MADTVNTIVSELSGDQPSESYPSTTQHSRTTRLVPFFTVYAPATFRKRNGEPLKHRALLNIVKRKKLTLVYGAGEPLCDPPEIDAILLEGAKNRPPQVDEQKPRGRGRPRLIAKG